MSILRQFRAAFWAFRATGKSKARGYPDWDGADRLTNMFGLKSEAVDHPKAYKIITTVRACVDLLMNDVASLPIVFEQSGRDGAKTAIERKPGNIVDVWESANQLESGYELARNEAAARLIHGTSYLFADRMREQSGLPKELTVLKSQHVQPIKGPRRSVAGYRWVSGASEIELPPEAIVPVREFNPKDEFEGLSFLHAVQIQFQLRHDVMRVLQKFLHNGGVPTLFFSNDSNAAAMRPEEWEAFKTEWVRRSGGVPNFFLPIHLAGMKVDRVGLSPKELGLLESIDVTDADIARAAKVPPWMVGIKEGTGFSTGSETDERNYWNSAVKPLVTLRDKTYSEKLCPLWGDGITMRTDFSGVPALQRAQAEQASKFVLLTGRPILTVNQALVKLGEPPSDDPTADELVIPFTAQIPSTLNPPRQMPDGEGARLQRGAPDSGAPDQPTPAPSNPEDELTERRRRAAVSLVRFERRLAVLFRERFSEQETRIVALVKTMVEAIRARAKGRRQGYTDIETALANDLLIEDEKLRQTLAALMKARGTEALTDIGLAIEYKLTGQKAAEFLANKEFRIKALTDQTTLTRLQGSLADGFRENETIGELVARIHDVFDARRDNALAIARTESTSAYNFVTQDAWEQGGVGTKAWLTAQDDVVRDSHREAEAQGEIPIGDDFNVGGYAMGFPGDPRGPAGEVVNCRCTLLAGAIAGTRGRPRWNGFWAEKLPAALRERKTGSIAELLGVRDE